VILPNMKCTNQFLFLDSALFTDMFTGHYSNPDGLCFDVLCTDEPIIDNPELEGNNVDQSVSRNLKSVSV